MAESELFRSLPSVEELAVRLSTEAAGVPRHLVVDEIRRVLDQARETIRSGRTPTPVENAVRDNLKKLAGPSLRPVINATGVVLHTNLGRAPLGTRSIISGYSNLEYDLVAGRRGRRDVHAGGPLASLLGVPAIAVNNNAAAVYLALHELAAGGEVIVSRGELIEIGDGFRIPDIMARSGAILREVGTTNRTRISDYEAAITEKTRLLLRVHPSNFRISGFHSRPTPAEMAELGRRCGIPVYEDLGSGCLIDLREFGIDEPTPQASLEAGIDLVSFSGDKLLGGPQAGILAGRDDLVARLRRNPMFRALRLDKVILQILEEIARAVLREQWDEIPALRLLRLPNAVIRSRTESLRESLGWEDAVVKDGQSVIGGGSTPEQFLPTTLLSIGHDSVTTVERKLRSHIPPVIARIEGNRLMIDLRTVFETEERDLVDALRSALIPYVRD